MAFRPRDFKSDTLSGNGSRPECRKDNPTSQMGAERYGRADNQPDSRGNGFRVLRGSPAASYSVLVRSWPMSATRQKGWPESAPHGAFHARWPPPYPRSKHEALGAL